MVGGREGGDVSAKVPSHLRESTGRKTPISSGLWSVWMSCLELWQTSCYRPKDEANARDGKETRRKKQGG